MIDIRLTGAEANEQLSERDNQETQNYSKVARGKSAVFSDVRFKNLKAKRITTCDTPACVPDDAEVKPRALYQINLNAEAALKKSGISEDKKSTIVIVSGRELPAAWGAMTFYKDAGKIIGDGPLCHTHHFVTAQFAG